METIDTAGLLCEVSVGEEVHGWVQDVNANGVLVALSYQAVAWVPALEASDDAAVVGAVGRPSN